MQKTQESKNVREISDQDAFDSVCGKVKFCLIAFFESVKVLNDFALVKYCFYRKKIRNSNHKLTC